MTVHSWALCPIEPSPQREPGITDPREVGPQSQGSTWSQQDPCVLTLGLAPQRGTKAAWGHLTEHSAIMQQELCAWEQSQEGCSESHLEVHGRCTAENMEYGTHSQSFWFRSFSKNTSDLPFWVPRWWRYCWSHFENHCPRVLGEEC